MLIVKILFHSFFSLIYSIPVFSVFAHFGSLGVSLVFFLAGFCGFCLWFLVMGSIWKIYIDSLNSVTRMSNGGGLWRGLKR